MSALHEGPGGDRADGSSEASGGIGHTHAAGGGETESGQSGSFWLLNTVRGEAGQARGGEVGMEHRSSGD